MPWVPAVPLYVAPYVAPMLSLYPFLVLAPVVPDPLLSVPDRDCAWTRSGHYTGLLEADVL